MVLTKAAGGVLVIADQTNTRGEIHDAIVARAVEFGIADPDAIMITREFDGTTTVSHLGFDEWPPD